LAKRDEGVSWFERPDLSPPQSRWLFYFTEDISWTFQLSRRILFGACWRLSGRRRQEAMKICARKEIIDQSAENARCRDISGVSGGAYSKDLARV
jgi:hypothetical protein